MSSFPALPQKSEMALGKSQYHLLQVGKTVEWLYLTGIGGLLRRRRTRLSTTANRNLAFAREVD